CGGSHETRRRMGSMTRVNPHSAWSGAAVGLCLLCACLSCMRAEAPAKIDHRTLAAQPDSITVGLWHLDEAKGGTVADAGPFRLHGTAGPSTRPDFGRFGNGRTFM